MFTITSINNDNNYWQRIVCPDSFVSRWKLKFDWNWSWNEKVRQRSGIKWRPVDNKKRNHVHPSFTCTLSSTTSRISVNIAKLNKGAGCVRFECACSPTVVCLIPRGTCNMVTCCFRFYQSPFPTTGRSRQTVCCLHSQHSFVVSFVRQIFIYIRISTFFNAKNSRMEVFRTLHLDNSFDGWQISYYFYFVGRQHDPMVFLWWTGIFCSTWFHNARFRSEQKKDGSQGEKETRESSQVRHE